MQNLKISINFESPVGSELQSDTIFGQFAWEFRYIYTEEKLKEVLADFSDKPFIVFSDGFEKDAIPMPFVKPENPKKIKEKFGNDYYLRMKEIKKARYIKIGDWLNGKVNLFSLERFIVNKPAYKSSLNIKNSVNRISNTTEQGLYSTVEKFFQSDVDIYIKYDDEKIKKEQIEEVFKSIGQFGFGRDKSVGKGRFRVIGLYENPEILENKKGRQTFISLSSGVPCDDCSVLFGKTFTKFGKHGGDLIFGNPFKNPAVLFKSGSVFKAKKIKDVYGRALEVSSYGGHYQNAYMIPLFVDMEE
jgi:CRISPR-associated protein Csm4